MTMVFGRIVGSTENTLAVLLFAAGDVNWIVLLTIFANPADGSTVLKDSLEITLPLSISSVTCHEP